MVTKEKPQLGAGAVSIPSLAGQGNCYHDHTTQSPRNQLDSLDTLGTDINGQKESQATAGSARLGSTCEVTLRFKEFAAFWAENPVVARFALQSEARSLLPGERVKNCLRVRISKDQNVEGWYNPALGKGHLANLQTCGSVWQCPVCAAKVTTRKREELSEGVEFWTGAGNSLVVATFTLQHRKTEECAEILAGITDSFSRFWRDRAGQKIQEKYRIAGRVRGLETTYTYANGWHIHFHGLLFIEGSIDPVLIGELQRESADHWGKVLSRHERYADSEHGVKISASEKDIADYVAKYGKEGMSQVAEKLNTWTESHEVTMGPIKRAGKGGLTPMQLLALSLCGDKAAGRLFVEYTRCFKGKTQVKWSKGLRDRLGLGVEKSDEEIAAEQKEAGSYLLVELRPDNWQVILGNAIRGEFVKVLHTGDSWKMLEFLEDYGITDAYLPDLVHDPNYHGPHRVYDDEETSVRLKGYIDLGRVPESGLELKLFSKLKKTLTV
jgi:hypothetical protein